MSDDIIDWNPDTQEKFKLMISKIPSFHRRITEGVVASKAKENADLRGALAIGDEDVITAFFSDVPSPFYSMMVRLLEHSGFDYRKYGFPKTQINTDKQTD